MSQSDNLTLLIATDLISRRIVPNRKTLAEWMKRKVDPFPQPIVLATGKKQAGSRRYSGRRVAWRVVDVERWLVRRERASEQERSRKKKGA